MSGSVSISKWPHIAKRQLWDGLPGEYEFRRHKHHDTVINGRKRTQADMESSYGESEIKCRDVTDPAYQSELLQTSKFYLLTKDGDYAIEREARVFRLQNGEWSLWDTDHHCVVTEKITDLRLMEQELMPPYATLNSVQKDWKDRKGVGKYLGLNFQMDEDLDWTMRHKVEREGKVTLEETKYRKEPEDRRKGWLERLAKGAKGGLQDMKGFFVVPQ